MLILAIDTSTSEGSAALIKDGKLIEEKISLHQKSHTEFMNSAISDLIRKNNFSFKDLSALACGCGPGSFTGIRVAVNIVKSFSYSLNLPIYTLDTLGILANQSARQFPEVSKIITLVNAHKNLMYFNQFRVNKGHATSPDGPRAVSMEELDHLVTEDILAVGDAYNEYFNALTPQLKTRLIRKSELSDYPRASDLGLWVSENQKNLSVYDWKTLLPLYIRASEAEEKLNLSTQK